MLRYPDITALIAAAWGEGAPPTLELVGSRCQLVGASGRQTAEFTLTRDDLKMSGEEFSGKILAPLIDGLRD